MFAMSRRRTDEVRGKSVLEHNLQGYDLPSDALMDLKRLFEKRFRSPFSEGLSPEGRLAMQQVLDHELSNTNLQRQDGRVLKGARTDKAKKRPKDKDDTRSKRTISFSDSFSKSGTTRLGGDITDERFSELDQKRRGIGGKPEAAMETIEIVKYGEAGYEDDMAIEETAKLNSVEKCLVWMEVNNDVSDGDNLNSSETKSH